MQRLPVEQRRVGREEPVLRVVGQENGRGATAAAQVLQVRLWRTSAAPPHNLLGAVAGEDGAEVWRDGFGEPAHPHPWRATQLEHLVPEQVRRALPREGAVDVAPPRERDRRRHAAVGGGREDSKASAIRDARRGDAGRVGVPVCGARLDRVEHAASVVHLDPRRPRRSPPVYLPLLSAASRLSLGGASSGPAAVTSPSDSHQPRATYISTTYPAAAHSCCLTAYSHQFITHELQRTTTGKRRVASAAPALGYATTAFSRAPPTPLMASSSHSTDNPPGFRSPRPPACARPSSDSVTRELANRPAFPTSPPNRVLASPTPSATDCLTCSSGAGSTSDDAGKEREPACAPAVPIWELTASSVSSADT
mmetsp:Transcript_15831/g.47105  ORF Transcript_15831/g.47105 Transcript_15831/m.47105 type:complete len:366 (+) Transcript_15831:430-1527(+)